MQPSGRLSATGIATPSRMYNFSLLAGQAVTGLQATTDLPMRRWGKMRNAFDASVQRNQPRMISGIRHSP
jgi:hypothetical protein